MKLWPKPAWEMRLGRVDMNMRAKNTQMDPKVSGSIEGSGVISGGVMNSNGDLAAGICNHVRIIRSPL